MARKQKRATITVVINFDPPQDPQEIHHPAVHELTTREQHARKPWWGKVSADGRFITWPMGESRRG